MVVWFPISKKIIWRLPIPDKCKLFNWLCYNRKILIAVVLEKKGFNGPRRCSLCYNASESTDHIMLQCTYSMEVWNMLPCKCQIFELPHDIDELWHGWRQKHRKIAKFRALDVLISVILWTLWEERKSRLFYSEARSRCETVGCFPDGGLDKGCNGRWSSFVPLASSHRPACTLSEFAAWKQTITAHVLKQN